MNFKIQYRAGDGVWITVGHVHTRHQATLLVNSFAEAHGWICRAWWIEERRTFYEWPLYLYEDSDWKKEGF